VAAQKSEAIAILDRLAALNLNAVVLQVRAHADAFYASELEPWSAYLTGAQGRPPEPFYDPLAFWIESAHARGLQLHAWFNPYRANHPANPGSLAPSALVKTRPDLVVRLGDKGYWWMDPALPAVQAHSLAVIKDVVRRYDIDGVHMDDYFYPYPSYNDGRDFPDDRSWNAYRAGGGSLSRADWRRRAVDTFIERVQREVKELKPRVAFGISPFGIWRPGHPPSIRGLDQYDVLFADARRWWSEGWVDYLTPQLYWPIGQIPQSFPVLLGWWARENRAGRHLWPGTSIARQRGDVGAREIVNQVMIARGMVPQAPGLCLFSAKWLMPADDPVASALLAGPWREPALVPPSPWLDDDPPASPDVAARDTPTGLSVRWTASPEVLRWVVWARYGARWKTSVFAARTDSLTITGDQPDAVGVAAVDRCGNIGPVTWAHLPATSDAASNTPHRTRKPAVAPRPSSPAPAHDSTAAAGCTILSG